MERGIIFDIQKFAVHDGPGIRTLVFLKGCPLSCWWCENPESQSIQPQLVFYPEKCIGCGACSAVCPHNAFTLKEDINIFHREKCKSNFSCTRVCPTLALEKCGEEMTVEQIVTEVIKDKPFYDKSGGGVTLSGGEPLMQPNFIKELLQELQSAAIQTAVETACFCKTEDVVSILPFTDLFLIDMKHMDSNTHLEVTGVANTQILENIKRIDSAGNAIIIRLPIIPGINDSDNNLNETAVFISELKSVKSIHLLPYHDLGRYKYSLLGMDHKMLEQERPSEKRLEEIEGLFKSLGMKVHIGG